MAARACIGTSGWSYQAWRGDFYPADLPARRWLDHIVEHFDTVEVNASHYRLPKPEVVQAWSDATPRHFRFAFKMWRAVTHYNRLGGAGARRNLERFFESVAPMPVGKRAPVLLQLHPTMRADTARLDEGLDLVRDVAGRGWRFAVEFRHPSWSGPAASEVLDRHDAALCLHDMPGSAVWDPNHASTVYVRRHGTTGKYQGSYSDAMLGADAARIRAWLDEGRDVYVYFNNDAGGHAPWDAARLRRLVDSFPPPSPRPARPTRRAREVALHAGDQTLRPQRLPRERSPRGSRARRSRDAPVPQDPTPDA